MRLKLEVAGFSIFEMVSAKIFKQSIDQQLQELEPLGRDAIGKIVVELDSVTDPCMDKEAQIAELREANK